MLNNMEYSRLEIKTNIKASLPFFSHFLLFWSHCLHFFIRNQAAVLRGRYFEADYPDCNCSSV